MEDEKKKTEVELKDTGEIELPQIEVEKYIGKEAKIELVTEHKGDYGYYVLVQTEIIDTITGGKEPIELRASKILGLHQDKDKKIGWGKKTKTGQYLEKMDVKHYKELVGKTVKVQTRTNSNGVDFLSFN